MKRLWHSTPARLCRAIPVQVFALVFGAATWSSHHSVWWGLGGYAGALGGVLAAWCAETLRRNGSSAPGAAHEDTLG